MKEVKKGVRRREGGGKGGMRPKGEERRKKEEEGGEKTGQVGDQGRGGTAKKAGKAKQSWGG